MPTIASLGRTDKRTTDNPPVSSNAVRKRLVRPQEPLIGGDGFGRIKGMKEPKLSATGKLVMLAEMAELFGVSKRTAWTYIVNEALKFPPPEDSLKAGTVWRRSAVEAWGKKHLFAVELKNSEVVVTKRAWQPGVYGGSLPVGRPPKKASKRSDG
jgi:predicted DNA-binding transcriptional regulator AlpA